VLHFALSHGTAKSNSLGDDELQSLAEGCSEASAANGEQSAPGSTAPAAAAGVWASQLGSTGRQGTSGSAGARAGTAEHVSAGAGCSQLQELDLSRHGKVTDAGLVALAQGCPQLRRVYFKSNARITENGVRALLENCPHLEVLKLVRVRNSQLCPVPTCLSACCRACLECRPLQL